MPAERFGIEVNFLTGRYVATSHNDRRKSEWPPHPARLFSALVDTWSDADEPDQLEREVLEWLEAQPPPAIHASEGVPRKVVSHFVPVNDISLFGNWYEKKALKVSELQHCLTEQLGSSKGEITKSVEKLQKSLLKENNVRSQVSKTGNTNPDLAQGLFSDYRGKQERFFPSITPDESRVVYTWECRIPDGLEITLDHILCRLTRLGHSSSLVSCRVVMNPSSANYIPDNNGKEQFRTVRSGQLNELEERQISHKGIRPRSLPYINTRYRVSVQDSTVEQPLKSASSGEWIVFEFSHNSRLFPATRTIELATIMRSAIFHYIEDPIPEDISGHRPDGTPTKKPHVAFLPLPYAGHTRSDGRLLGIALSLPSTLSNDSRRALYRAIASWEDKEESSKLLKLTLGHQGVIEMYRLRQNSTLVSLRQNLWNGPSHRWISATPVALPKHPGRLTGGTQIARARSWKRAKDAVVTACINVGLPKPLEVQVSLHPLITGAYHAMRFPALNQGDRSGNPIRRQLVHTSLIFEHRVQGPLALGAGRFLGLGLMCPAPETRAKDSDRNDTNRQTKTF